MKPSDMDKEDMVLAGLFRWQLDRPTDISPRVAEAQYLYTAAELEYAVALVRACYPYMEELVGIASAMRRLVPDLTEFLQRHGGIEGHG